VANVNWLGYALLSAVAAGATAILAKMGVAGVPSELATALRTAVVFALTGAFVAGRGEVSLIGQLSARNGLFLAASGAATAISWFAYFKALQMAPASRVVPIDKLSLPISMALAFLVLGEVISARMLLGVALMVIGAVLTIRP
jgi:bacterial/archaeal transporter family protein